MQGATEFPDRQQRGGQHGLPRLAHEPAPWVQSNLRRLLGKVRAARGGKDRRAEGEGYVTAKVSGPFTRGSCTKCRWRGLVIGKKSEAYALLVQDHRAKKPNCPIQPAGLNIERDKDRRAR